MQTDERDRKIAKDGRKNVLENVEAPLKEQVIEKLVKKLEKLGEGQRTLSIWHTGNMRRATWLKRQEKFIWEYDEFLEPIYDASQDWSSTLHLPITYTVIKTVHARMLAALIDLDPPFVVKAREGSNEEKAPFISDLIRYGVKDYANCYQGVEAELDAWVWNWVAGGCGILKNRWLKKYTRFTDVVTVPDVSTQIRRNEDGTEDVIPIPTSKEVEKDIVITAFDGPMMEDTPPEDVLIIGGKGDPQKADEVLHKVPTTAGEMWSLVDQGIFRKAAVKKAIEYGESTIVGDLDSAIKITKAQKAGVDDPDTDLDAPRYDILERYCRIDVDGSGIPADIVMWVHKGSGEILRATYLYRISPSGTRPFFKIDFHKRVGQDYGVGLTELLYSLTKELDAIHNMKIDFGLLSSMPMGFVRATSSMTEERIPLEPGTLIPVDNPQTDVYFPNMGNKGAFAANEEQFLLSQISRLTSVDDFNLGVIGGQGITRTATGARALMGESNANLNVYLRRANRGWKQALQHLFEMFQLRVPIGLQFRIVGDGGVDYWRVVRSREEIAGKMDFELDANSANSNKQVQEAVASEVYQLTGNPLDIQLGIITPLERYNALKLVMQSRGIRDYSRFARKPQGIVHMFTPEEIANRVLRGTDIPLTPDQDLQGFINYFQHIISDDQILGQFSEQQTILLAQKAKEAQAMLDAMKAQAAQAANQQQIAMNANLSSGSSATVPGFNAPTGGMLGET